MLRNELSVQVPFFDVVDIGHGLSNGLANSIAPNVGAIG
jgi:hypothetical protein